MPSIRGTVQPSDTEALAALAMVAQTTEPYFAIQQPQKRAFLGAFAVCGSVTKAALLAKIDRSLHYQWLHSDDAYAVAFAAAKDLAADTLEDEAIRRAVEGVKRTIYYKDAPVGEETVYSDTLLIFMLKGLRPEKYRDNAHIDVTTEVNVALEARTRDAAERIKRLRDATHQHDAAPEAAEPLALPPG